MTQVRLQLRSSKMKCPPLSLIAIMCACLASATASAVAQLAPDQTHGFGKNKLVTFTYLQNFDCVDQPKLDLDFNGILARSDPNEMQVPICQPVTEPTQDPTGGSIAKTAHLYVLVPMFSVDNDQNPNDAMQCPNGGRQGELCGHELGEQLINFSEQYRRRGKRRLTPLLPRSVLTPTIPCLALAPCMHRQSICRLRWLRWGRLVLRPRTFSFPLPTTAMLWTTTSSIRSRSGGRSDLY